MDTVVCFGDSNTHGADPVTHGRFARDVRWPGVLAAELGGAAAVVEEGLNGRTTVWDDPFMDFRNGKPYLLPCLRSHQPVDVLVLMLGTNDLKTIFGRAAHEIAAGAGALVDIALTSGTGPGGGPPAVLLVAPPRLGDITDRSEIWGFGEARAKAEALPRLYRNVAGDEGRGVPRRGRARRRRPGRRRPHRRTDHAVLGRAMAVAVRALLAGR